MLFYCQCISYNCYNFDIVNLFISELTYYKLRVCKKNMSSKENKSIRYGFVN